MIFGAFYLGSGIGIDAFARIRDAYGNYDNALYVAAGVLVVSAIVLVLLPRYRFAAGATASQAVPAPAPAPQQA